jgi:hypothetical protein
MVAGTKGCCCCRGDVRRQFDVVEAHCWGMICSVNIKTSCAADAPACSTIWRLVTNAHVNAFIVTGFAHFWKNWFTVTNTHARCYVYKEWEHVSQYSPERVHSVSGTCHLAAICGTGAVYAQSTRAGTASAACGRYCAMRGELLSRDDWFTLLRSGLGLKRGTAIQ